MQIEGDTTRKNLIGIISRYGQNILEDPKKLKNLLLDLNQGIEKKEVNIICNSLDDKIPFDLIKNKDNLPYDISADRSIQRLQNSYGITEDLARWTVDTWAIALHVITEKGNIQLNRKPATVPVPSSQHQAGTTQSVSRPLPEVNSRPEVVFQNRVNDKSTKTGPDKKTPVIKTKLEPVQDEYTPYKKTQDVYIHPVSTPQPISGPMVPLWKKQLTGNKYYTPLFILLLIFGILGANILNPIYWASSGIFKGIIWLISMVFCSVAITSFIVLFMLLIIAIDNRFSGKK